MARRCELSGKGVMTGNNVSHAHNKTRRRYLPNLQTTTLFSETLGESVKLKVCMDALRTVEHKGGFDAYLLDASDTDLTTDMTRLKKRLKKAVAANAA